MNTSSLSATELARSPKERKLSQKEIMVELEAMSLAMVKEEGLLNHSQAALILEITPARVTELVNLEKLKRFDFLGRTYVSVREVLERREADIKAGRPARGFFKRLAVVAGQKLQEDSLQKLQGGYDAPYEKAKRKAKRVK